MSFESDVRRLVDQLTIMVGGTERGVNDAWPVLAACGNRVHLGSLGSGQVAKACNQMIVAATVLALGEAAVLADCSGLDLDKLFRFLAGGYADSRILQTRGDRTVREDYSAAGQPDTWPEMGVAARGRPRLGELAESTSRLLPYVRVPLVLIDEGASRRRDGRIAPISITWRTRRPACALPRRGTGWADSS